MFAGQARSFIEYLTDPGLVYDDIERDRGSPKETPVLRKPGHSVYITDAMDLPSFLEPDGPLSASVIRFTEYLGSIIAGASRSPSPDWQTLKLKCRRRPGRRPCPGSIRVRIGEETPPEIYWDCPRCGERGIIRNWRGSEWDNSDDRWDLFEAERSCAESMFQALPLVKTSYPSDRTSQEAFTRGRQSLSRPPFFREGQTKKRLRRVP